MMVTFRLGKIDLLWWIGYYAADFTGGVLSACGAPATRRFRKTHVRRGFSKFFKGLERLNTQRCRVLRSVFSSEGDHMQQVLDNIHMVMVNTTHPGNIGAAARAIKNMCLSQLILVDPKEYPSPKAVWRAANADDVLDAARVVSSIDEAIEDCGLIIGTSARERRIPWPLLNPRECGEKIVAEAKTHKVAVLFGREDRGLTNEELQKCHFHVHIPANPDYSSLNIAAALQVISYEIRMAYLSAMDGKAPSFDDWDMPPAKGKDLEMYFTHLEETLAKLGFYDPKNPRQTMTRIRRLFNRIRMDEMELSIMRGFLTSIQNFIYRSEQEKPTNTQPDEPKPES